MIVEVVAREIGKQRDVERNAVNPSLLQRVRRDFHHRFGASGIERAREQLIQLQRLGRGVRRGQDLVADAVLHRTHQHGLALRRLQHAVKNERCGGLAVGPGDAGDFELLRRAMIEVGAQTGQCSASMRHLRPRNARPRRQRIAHDGHRSRRERLVYIKVAVRRLALDGDKTPSRLDPPAVVVKARDGRVALLSEYSAPSSSFQEVHSERIIVGFAAGDLTAEAVTEMELWLLASFLESLSDRIGPGIDSGSRIRSLCHPSHAVTLKTENKLGSEPGCPSLQLWKASCSTESLNGSECDWQESHPLHGNPGISERQSRYGQPEMEVSDVFANSSSKVHALAADELSGIHRVRRRPNPTLAGLGSAIGSRWHDAHLACRFELFEFDSGARDAHIHWGTCRLVVRQPDHCAFSSRGRTPGCDWDHAQRATAQPRRENSGSRLNLPRRVL